MIPWLAALFAGLAPSRYWRSLERHLPIRSAAAASGTLTLLAGVALGARGFFTFATELADANNRWMLTRLVDHPSRADTTVALVPYGMSILTFFIFIFFTPTGLLATYLTASGTLRAAGAWFDDPHGDYILTALDWAATTMFRKNAAERREIGRRKLEGDETPDVLQTGEWAGLADVDFVVLASRRKAEWDAGAIILTSTDWYRLGVPFDTQTPAGLRTAYPLKKMDTVEVVRRGIQYELPRLRGTQRPQRAQS